ncbi:MAG: tail fiber domain-containing protein [Ginsengibacter sp.]
MKTFTLTFAVIIFSVTGFTQNVAINATGSNADNSAMLDVSSTTKGFLMPRLTTTQQNAISLPANGLTIFNTTLNTIMMNTGTSVSPVWTGLNSGTIDTSSIANFYVKVRSVLSSTAPITYTNGRFGITQSGTSSDGYLSSTDWNTFNNKADAANSWSTLGNTLSAEQKIGTLSNHDFPFYTNNTEKMRLTSTGRLGIGMTPTAVLHLKAGSAAANTAPLKFTSGSTMSTPEVGAVEFLTDKFYGTITTGTSRKEFTFNDAPLVSGRVPYATTNGRLISSTAFTFASATGRLSPNYITLAAGTAAVGTAPLVMTAGVNLTTPTAGAVEFDGSHFYGTVGSTRYQLDQQSANSWSTTGNSGTSYLTNFLGPTDNRSLRFRTNNVEGMIIDSTGNVGIGTSDFNSDQPEKLLIDAGTYPYNGSYTYLTPVNAVGASNGFVQMQVQNRSWGNYSSSDLVAASDGTNNGTLPVNTYIHYVDFGINSSGYTNNNSNILNQPYTAYLYSTTPENFFIGNGYSGKDMIFFTNSGPTNNNNTADGFEVMRLKGGAARQVTIGTPTPNGANRLTVSGSVSASMYNVSSDRRLKLNIKSLNYGLKEILELQPVSYSWKENPSKDPQLGLIAQDVKVVVPEIVSGDENTGTLSINYTAIIPILINAIKDQQKQIDELKKEIQLIKVH